jgi:hypothetical protein
LENVIAENSEVSLIPPPPSNIRKKKNAEDSLNEYETDETKLLSTQQLQRLVMLEQVKVLRLKRMRMEKEAAQTTGAEIVIVSSQEQVDLFSFGYLNN